MGLPVCKLIRQSTSEQGTCGIIITPYGTKYFTLEPPWRDNQHDISCILPGEYEAYTYNSKKHGIVYMVSNVKGRKGIEIHVGNWAGDVSKGLYSDSLGCILIGLGSAVIKTPKGNLQVAVTDSRKALIAFMKEMQNKSFVLEIRWLDETNNKGE